MPIPLAGPFKTPELALFKREHQEGVAKLAVTSFDCESGLLHSSSGATFGSSSRDRWVILFLGWTDEDMGRAQAGTPRKREEEMPKNGGT